MAWDTAAQVVNDAAVELGLTSADVAEPFGSRDANLLQLCRLLKAAGKDLVRAFAWTHLTKQHTFDTVAAQATYSLPSDFGRLVDTTGHDRTSQAPLLGPLSAQGWQTLAASGTSGTTGLFFRLVGGDLSLYPTPSSAVTVAFEYVSRYWVQPADSGGSVPTSSGPTAGTDACWFDSHLLTRALKLRFLQAKGFDATAAQDDYLSALVQAQGADGAAPILNLSGRSAGGHRLLDGGNVPEGGW
jgi:hypothetical protein